MSLDLQAGLDCCCLALQLPRLWNVASSPEMVTHTCSLIHCVRCLLEASESPHLASALRFNWDMLVCTFPLGDGVQLP